MVIFDAQRISKKIAAARKEKNMTQMDLADQLGVSYQAVSNWERSQSLPDIDKYGSLAKVLDLSLDDLLDMDNAEHRVTIVQDSDSSVDADTLATFAPVMKPKQVDAKAAQQTLPAAHLKDIAPYLSDAALHDQLISHETDTDFLELVQSLAPTLSDDDLNQIVQDKVLPNLPDSWPTLKKLLPFLSDDTVTEILTDDWGTEKLTAKQQKHFYPFVASTVLFKLLTQHQALPSDYIVAAPFLDDNQITELFHDWQTDPEQTAYLSKLAPFAPSAVIASYVRQLVAEKDSTTDDWHRYLPFLDDDDLLSLGKDRQ
ncbi:MAG: helix-turn-helix transcriptional regulator [Schleiferilactobacillus perolens]|uniref:helix-turn-helix domain-containing protein n=1 Tax=Schleiferilactobacillus perolens TaxID=100468 RepID=UPI0039EA77F4